MFLFALVLLALAGGGVAIYEADKKAADAAAGALEGLVGNLTPPAGAPPPAAKIPPPGVIPAPVKHGMGETDADETTRALAVTVAQTIGQTGCKSLESQTLIQLFARHVGVESNGTYTQQIRSALADAGVDNPPAVCG